MTVALWTSLEVAAATGGEPVGDSFAVTGINLDSRTIVPGDLFVALAGDRDGHDFVGDAMLCGAAGAMVSRPVDGPHILVRDTLDGLWRLARAARDRAAHCRRAAVTGSVGKTSTTQAIAAALRLAGSTHAPINSYNNHIGVPITIAGMPAKTKFAVFEAGMNNPGELSPLSQLIQPDVAVVTRVGNAHVQNFTDGEIGVAKAKAEIFDGLLPNAVAVLNADCPWFDLLCAAAHNRGARVLTFGSAQGCDAQFLAFERDAARKLAVVRLHGSERRLRLGPPGAHWAMNSLAVVLTVEALGAPVEAAVESLASFSALVGRGAERTIHVAEGQATIVDESYNANPLSMGAALETLRTREVQGRRLAVLTDMLELGSDAAALHAKLCTLVEAAGVDLLFAAGPLMKKLYQVVPVAMRGRWTPHAAELVPVIREAILPGDVILVKGSHGSKASAIVEGLCAAERPA